MENNSSIVKKIIIGSLLGAAVFIIIAFMADYKKVASALMDFPLRLWPFILFLSLMNYAFRVVKWDFYLDRLYIKIPRVSSVLIFFSGFIMAITPGKMGEVLKSLLLYERHGVPVTRSAPVVFMERLTDVLALLFICASGVAFALMGGGQPSSLQAVTPSASPAGAAAGIDPGQLISLGAVAALTIILIAVISNQKLIMAILKFMERFAFIKKHIVHIESLFESARVILKPWPLFYATFLSILAWALECYSLYYIITIISPGTIEPLPLLIYCSFAYAFSTIIGALAMLPGGLFVTEGGMAFLLVKLTKVSMSKAVAATFMVRAATLWFALLIGMAALPAFKAYCARVKNEPEPSERAGVNT
ncbi:MAG TPA: hypothetical protein DC017_15485 [Candidatus Wallbacteria bacterium]|nr:hypothetical protein [Candidatus Wallbacteria bacterium]